MSAMRALLAQHPIVPVIVIDDSGAGPELAAALLAGGIRCAEVTLRTPAGLDAIAAMSASGLAVGAGTVLTVDDLDRAADAGAVFAVSPGYDAELVRHAASRGIPALPGVATATEVQHAVRDGLDAVKFFPADRLGGLDTIAALAGPFPELAFVPSGGVSTRNLADYLAHPSVPAVSGSWMAGRDLIRAGDFARIAELSAAAVAALPEGRA